MAPRNTPLKMGTQQIQGLADGIQDTDAATVGQLNAAIAAIDLTPYATDAELTAAISALNISSYAPLASPAFTGNPTAPTASPGDNDTSIATTAFVTAAIAAIPPAWTIVEKTTGQTISLSAVLTDDNDLQFAMEANKTYAIRISLAFSFITGGYQYGITGPSSPTSVRWGTSNAYGLIGSGGTNGQQIVWLTVKIENGANAGNFKVQFCQSSGAAGSITMENGSYLEYREIS